MEKNMGIEKGIFVIGSIKGGVGKSTVCYNLAAFLTNKGYDVIMVDSDKQRSLSQAADIRNAGEFQPPLHSVEQLGRTTATIKELARRYDIVLVDCAGHDSIELRSALLVADMLISPLAPTQFDLLSADQLYQTILDSKVINPDLKSYILLNKTSSNPKSSEVEDAVEYMKDFPELPVLKSRISTRKIFADSIKLGIGVTEMNQTSLNTSAKKAFNDTANEIEALWNEIEEIYATEQC